MADRNSDTGHHSDDLILLDPGVQASADKGVGTRPLHGPLASRVELHFLDCVRFLVAVNVLFKARGCSRDVNVLRQSSALSMSGRLAGLVFLMKFSGPGSVGFGGLRCYLPY